MTDEPKINQMSAKTGDLTEQLSAAENLTNEQLLQSIIDAPTEKLIPWEDCHLPSKGIYYGWSDGVVQVRAMGQTAEKVLATQRLAQSGQSIDYLFRECCRFPEGFDPVDLLLGDRVFLLYYLRGITHGNIYEFAVTCPNEDCRAVSTHSYDLNNLAGTIKWADSSLGQEPFKIVLPYMSKVVGKELYIGVRFLRGYDANDILAKRKMNKKLQAKPGQSKPGARRFTPTIDDSISDNLAKVIVSVMGVEDKFVIKSFVERLHAQDTAEIREWLKDHTPGIDTTVSLTCPECDTEFTVELPITENFFRPSK